MYGLFGTRNNTKICDGSFFTTPLGGQRPYISRCIMWHVIEDLSFSFPLIQSRLQAPSGDLRRTSGSSSWCVVGRSSWYYLWSSVSRPVPYRTYAELKSTCPTTTARSITARHTPASHTMTTSQPTTTSNWSPNETRRTPGWPEPSIRVSSSVHSTLSASSIRVVSNT